VQGRTRPLDVWVDAARSEGPHLRLTAGARVDRYDFGITKMKGVTGRYLDIRLDITADRR
jgi:hypothetical protein